MEAFQFHSKGGGIKCDPEVLEKANHPKQTCDRQIVRKSRASRNEPARHK